MYVYKKYVYALKHLSQIPQPPQTAFYMDSPFPQPNRLFVDKRRVKCCLINIAGQPKSSAELHQLQKIVLLSL